MSEVQSWPRCPRCVEPLVLAGTWTDDGRERAILHPPAWKCAACDLSPVVAYLPDKVTIGDAGARSASLDEPGVNKSGAAGGTSGR